MNTKTDHVSKDSTPPSPPNRLQFAMAILAGGFLIAVLTTEKLVWQKILTQLFMPVGLIWLLLTALLIASWVGGQRWYTVGLGFVWLAFTVSSNTLVGNALVSTLEHAYVNQVPLEMAPFDKLIVLGGGTNCTSIGTPQLGSGGDRIRVAAQMYHAGKVKQILVTGQQIKALVGDDLSDPSEQATILLTQLGVPADRIQPVGGRNTLEETQALGKIITPGERVGLITSAWHLPRVLRRARDAGLEIVPVPAAFAVTAGKTSVLSAIPKQEGFENTTRTLNEYLGMLVGR